METTICHFCHKLVYVGFIEYTRFLFDDPDLQHAHTKTKCQLKQKSTGLEDSIKTIQEQILQIREEILKIKEKIDLD